MLFPVDRLDARETRPDQLQRRVDYAMRAMAGRDYLITALFQRPPWTVDSPDYRRTGRMHPADSTGRPFARRRSRDRIYTLQADLYYRTA